MLDIGWSEMAVIAVVALVVIGPRDLPTLLYTAGKLAGKARAALRDLQQGIEDMAREAELNEVRDKIESVRSFDVRREIAKTVDPTGELAGALEPAPGDRQDSVAGTAPLQEAEADGRPPLPAAVPGPETNEAAESRQAGPAQ